MAFKANEIFKIEIGKTIEFSNDHFGKTNAHNTIFVIRMVIEAFFLLIN